MGAEDIERKQTQEKLQVSEAKFRALSEHAPAAIFIYQGNNIRYANPATEAITGYNRKELFEMNFWDIAHPDFRDLLRERGLARQRREPVPLRYEFKIVTKAGEERWVDFTDGTFEFEGKLAVVALCFDITERKQAEEALRKSEIKYKELLNSTLDGVYRTDADGVFIVMNHAGASILGYEIPEEMIGRNIRDCWRDPVERDAFIRELRIKKSVSAYPFGARKKNGEPIELEASSSIIEDEKGNLLGVWGILRNVTEQKRVEETLRQSEEHFRAIFEVASIGIAQADINTGKWLRVNDKMCEITGYTAGEMLQMRIPEITHPEDRQRDWDEFQRVVRGEAPNYRLEKRYIRKDGSIVWVSINMTVIRDSAGRPIRTIATIEDITERKKAEERIEYLAYYDALTGLPNRNLFIDRLEQAIAAAPSSKLVTVLITDIDRFKSVNDVYGAEVGDTILNEVAKRLSGIVKKGGTVARLGNDEFGMVLIGSVDSGDIIGPEKVIRDASYPLKIGSREITLTFSTGISLFPHDGRNAHDLLRAAGLALAASKKEGGRSCQFYSEDMNIKTREFLSMERNLHNAIKNEEFLLHYQPYWDINTKKMLGMEALIRWQRKDQGLVSPGKFIPVLEETGLIIDVGKWILRTAVRQVKDWQNNDYPVVPVSVNLSLIQFKQKDMVDMVRKVIGEFGFYPSLLTLEITESAFMEDIEFTSWVIKELKDIRVSVSIDDFGTGYSSLAHLKRFPIDNLKIDMSFIREIVKDPDSASIVMAIINMAHTLQLKTIAEGIETEEQWKFLRLLKCDMGQGFYFSKPLPAEEIEEMLVGDRQT